MNTSKLPLRNRWDLLLSLITLICLLLSWQREISPEFEWIWLGCMMIFTGIPHGATDHLVHWHKQKEKGAERSWRAFLLPYLLQMLLYGLAWIILPVWSFLLFLGISFYHFGQSQLYYLELPEENILKKFLYLLWGAWILAIILLSDAQESFLYLEEILPATWIDVSGWEQAYLPLVGGLSGLIFVLFIFLWAKRKMTSADLIRELGVGALLGISLHVCSLWISFGLYFGLWHATKAIRAELSLMKHEDPTWSLKDWIRQALPFSLISFLGLFLLVFLWQNWGQSWHPVFLFFVGISMLTLPHMTTLEHMYKYLK